MSQGPISARSTTVPHPIEAHGVVGDQSTAALVADDATVDFLCWPRFDSPSIFAGLLDPARGGTWRIAPDLDGARRRQIYLPDTNVLQTRFLATDGVGEVTDFMPFPEPGRGPRLIRRVRAVRGEVRFRLRCTPRFDYGRGETRAAPAGPTEVRFHAPGGDGPTLALRGTVALAVERGPDAAAVAAFTLRAGERAEFLLADAEAGPSDPAIVEDLFDACVAHWHGWAAQCGYRGRWREAVMRSALVLKLLTSKEHGSIVAAVTFGLPEAPKGERNWDYRAVWIRDASFSVNALLALGYVEEARAFMGWMGARAAACGEDGRLEVMYRIDGSMQGDETALAHLAGYDGAAPVRIGNGAHDQVQLDIYGEFLDAVWRAQERGVDVSHDGWAHVCRSVDYVCAHWQEPDHGIWEVRGEPKPWLHSRMSCWLALDRAIKLAVRRSFPAPLVRWHAARDAIYASIWSEFWDAARGHLVAQAGGDTLDAAMLLLPLLGFVSPTDPRWLATLDAIGRELTDDPLVYRYRRPDSLGGREGAFTACSFMYVDCLAQAGRLAEARLVFEKMLGYANPLGLFSEEIGLSGDQLGNTPQALTHLALIMSALTLDAAVTRAECAVPPI